MIEKYRQKLNKNYFRDKRLEMGFVPMRVLSEFTGIGINTLYAYETMKKLPSFKHAKILSDALETNIGYLFPKINNKLIKRLENKEIDMVSLGAGMKKPLSFINANNLVASYLCNKLDDALTYLDEKERRIIEARFLNFCKIKFSVIAKELGLSKARVWQIKSIALKKLNKIIVNR